MLNTKVFLVISLFILWSFGSGYWYICKIKGLCIEENTLPEKIVPEPIKGNLTFNKGSTIPETNEETRITIDSIGGISMDTLMIVGLHFANENASLGLERAKNTSEIFKHAGFKRPIITSSKMNSKRASEKFTALEFKPIITEVVTQNEEEFKVEKSIDKMVIYFPIASAKPETNKKLIDELKSFASNIIEKQQKIDITGHTDDSGSHEVNVQYGQLRADAIKNTLIQLGVDSKNIKTLSKGESEPISSNKNASGRKKNRRVEIRILTNQ